MIKVKFSGNFDKMYRNLVENDPALRDLIADSIQLFENNPDDTRLDNHPLTKRMRGKWAFSITNNIRIVYEMVGKQRVRFLVIGKHDEVYK